MNEIEQKTFWMVWCPNGHAPTVKHPYKSDAYGEAERLARNNPGQIFIVLQAIGARKVDDMVRISLTEEADIPF